MADTVLGVGDTRMNKIEDLAFMNLPYILKEENKIKSQVQLTLEQHDFELCGFTYTWIFFLINTVQYCRCIFSFYFLKLILL